MLIHFFEDRFWLDKLFKSVEGIAFWVVLVLFAVGVIYNLFNRSFFCCANSR